MARPGMDFGFADPVEMEDHLDMRKSLQLGQGIGRKPAVQFDRGLLQVLRIIYRLCPAAPHPADGSHHNFRLHLGSDR
jgi:hypothetical protein